MELKIAKRGRKTLNRGYSLPAHLATFIDEQAKHLNVSRSALVAAILEEYYRAEVERAEPA